MTTRTKEPPGPDQAAGWLIAMACFFINFICAGLARTAGVLYVALIELYGVSREAATTPFSIRVCVRNMTGPLIGLLGLKYGIRAVTTCGGFVAALGSVLCYFAPNVFWITIFWGVIHGIGFGLGTVLHMMVIGLYFDKYKASALGLGYSGDCFGTFVFPVIMETLLANFDVQGTFLILGGIVLHVIPMAMLLKNPPWLKLDKTTGNFSRTDVQKGKPSVQNCFKNDGFTDFSQDLSSANKVSVLNSLRNEGFADSNQDLTSSISGRTKPRSFNDDPPMYREVILRDRRVNCLRYESSSMSGSLRSHGNRSDISEFVRENMDRHDSLPPVLEKETNEGEEDTISGSFSIASNDLPNGTKSPSTENRSVQHSDSMRKPRTSSIMGQMVSRMRTASLASQAHDIVHRMRTASFASQVAQDGFICNLQLDQKEDHGRTGDTQTESEQHDTYTAKNIAAENSSHSINVEEGHPDTRAKEDGVLVTLLRTNTKPIFVLISMTMAVFAFLFVGVLTIIIDYAADQGISQDKGKYLIIGFSLTDLIGRLSFGQVLDRQLVKMKNYAGVTTLLMGILVGAIPLNRSFNYVLVVMCLYGLVQGGAAIMFPILISCYMDKGEESIAMGSLNFYGGLLMLSLAPMIGYFRDNTGSYNGVFYILGGLMSLIGIAWQFEPPILKYQNRKLHKRHAKFFLQESH